jgi:serine/threonine protein kinase
MTKLWSDSVCRDLMQYYPVSKIIPGAPDDIGIFMVVCGLLYIAMSLLTIMWIKRKEAEAQAEYGREDAVKSVIFPVFVYVLWANVFYTVYQGILIASVPVATDEKNSSFASILFASSYAIGHMIIEGVAFLLMQKGCGQHAARAAAKWSAMWGIATFILMFFIFHNGGDIAVLLEIVWDMLMFLFYIFLWLAPQKRLFRRPAAILYARFWTIYRTATVIINCTLLFKSTENTGACGYIFVSFFFLSIMQPLVCYWTLLQDSRWWQGLALEGAGGGENGVGGQYEDGRDGDIRAPLIGSDFSLHSAQSLAITMDQMRVQGGVRMLNFACIKLDKSSMLGAGSFSKVYRGTYRGQDCAIKLIYTVDLTADVIKRVAAEASILSSIKHPNIVNILGVSVLPPSVCLILELCSFGSLSDIIRGYGFDWNTSSRFPLHLTRADLLHLALGCARGVAAVHAYDASICHRDVKSFNFLVDRRFDVKIADLELGITTMGAASSGEQPRRGAAVAGNSRGSLSQYDVRESERTIATNETLYMTPAQVEFSRRRRQDPTLVVVEELLANWLAPEVLTDRKFCQASDTYSLGTVIWEIMSGQLPFDNEPQLIIRQKICGGYKHPLPSFVAGTPLGSLIESCWEMNPLDRPLSSEVCDKLQHIMYTTEAYDLLRGIEAVPNTASLREFYAANYTDSAPDTFTLFSGRGRRSEMSQPTTTSGRRAGRWRPWKLPRWLWSSDWRRGGSSSQETGSADRERGYSSVPQRDLEDNADSEGDSRVRTVFCSLTC